MSRKTRKRGRRRLLVIVVLLALIVFGVFARGLLTSGKTTAERAQRELLNGGGKGDDFMPRKMMPRSMIIRTRS